MDLAAFIASLRQPDPPEGLPPLLRGLWQDAKGDWSGAHEIAQAQEGRLAAWVHAYLHRKEGDLSNAGYWYRRAGKPPSRQSLRDEWEAIASALLQDNQPF